MQPDPDYLRQHYALLSDEALLEIDRTDLVDVAQQLYDHEMNRRQLALEEPDDEDSRVQPSVTKAPSYEQDYPASSVEGQPPDWHEEAADVFSSSFRPGSTPAPEIYTAREILEAARIPCYLDTLEEEDGSQRCRIMVPGKLNFRAHSLIQKEMSNEALAASWKTHLEVLSDDELADMNPREVFCDLYDLIERVTTAYNEELAHRQRA